MNCSIHRDSGRLKVSQHIRVREEFEHLRKGVDKCRIKILFKKYQTFGWDRFQDISPLLGQTFDVTMDMWIFDDNTVIGLVLIQEDLSHQLTWWCVVLERKENYQT